LERQVANPYKTESKPRRKKRGDGAVSKQVIFTDDVMVAALPLPPKGKKSETYFQRIGEHHAGGGSCWR
jgi:hypothetical protein